MRWIQRAQQSVKLAQQSVKLAQQCAQVPQQGVPAPPGRTVLHDCCRMTLVSRPLSGLHLDPAAVACVARARMRRPSVDIPQALVPWTRPETACAMEDQETRPESACAMEDQEMAHTAVLRREAWHVPMRAVLGSHAAHPVARVNAMETRESGGH